MPNIFKNGYFSQDRESQKKVIDSNKRIAERIEYLYRSLSGGADSDGFTAGLRAEDLTDDVLGRLTGESETEADSAEEPESADPADILVDANAQADQILANASAEADRILSEARDEAQRIKAAASAEGHNEGYEQGYNEAVSEFEQKKQELEEHENALRIEFDKKCEELEPMFIDTLTGIYEHIFHVRFDDDKQVIFYLIQDAVRTVDSSEAFIIHVSRDDYGFVSMQRKELLSGISGAENAEIVEDISLKRNQCFIETGNGIFDCSLETQLSGLKRQLKLLSYSH